MNRRALDALVVESRRMSRMAVEKDYAFDGPHGPVGLLEPFQGCRQYDAPTGHEAALSQTTNSQRGSRAQLS